MTLSPSRATFPRAVALFAALTASLAPVVAAAQPTPVPPADTNPIPAAPPPVVQSQITGQTPGEPNNAAPGSVPSAAAPSALGPIERLPDTAYPSYPIRGLYGGSLWQTFHGLQWPYYPKTGIGISGYVWLDSGYARFNISPRAGTTSQSQIIQSGRLLFRATPTWSNGKYFVQGQAELVASRNQLPDQPNAEVDADDVWIRFGMWNVFDITVGRFEAWEVYHYGMGLDQYSFDRDGAAGQVVGGPQVPIYGLTYAFYRQPSVGQAAAHAYLTKNLRFELSSQFGIDSQDVLAVRPVGIYDLGFLKVKAGAEYQARFDYTDGQRGSTTSRGVGGAVEFVLDPIVEGGISAAYGLVDSYKSDATKTYNAAASNTTYSIGPFINVRPLPQVVPDLLVGFGYDYTYLEDQQYDPTYGRHGKFRHQQVFGAVQYYLWKQLMIKGVFGYAKADLAPTLVPPPSLYSNEELSGRLRLEYLY